jgi:hypothetical protein
MMNSFFIRNLNYCSIVVPCPQPGELARCEAILPPPLPYSLNMVMACICLPPARPSFLPSLVDSFTARRG